MKFYSNTKERRYKSNTKTQAELDIVTVGKFYLCFAELGGWIQKMVQL
jgi:hypothetical protein